MRKPICDSCGSDLVYRAGVVAIRKGHFQRWKCRNCGHVFLKGKVDRGQNQRQEIKT